MDRFESDAAYAQVLDRLYLHSNMDRFERRNALTIPPVQEYLHSNMDRFERFIKAYTDVQLDVIYIPIWIDLKAISPLCLSFLVTEFTFQYG